MNIVVVGFCVRYWDFMKDFKWIALAPIDSLFIKVPVSLVNEIKLLPQSCHLSLDFVVKVMLLSLLHGLPCLRCLLELWTLSHIVRWGHMEVKT